mmetsp:Transcript_37362/g.115201  ORF Transcript_37362/g.115201 Transcript_37362/m.115201 type:complete len:85 (-) Transcript_37362:308-562(-)
MSSSMWYFSTLAGVKGNWAWAFSFSFSPTPPGCTPGFCVDQDPFEDGLADSEPLDGGFGSRWPAEERICRAVWDPEEPPEAWVV